ncbi:hypothetical protein C4569_02755 [Candidatus Parcubacteria bacterium]|nr:MAG: hypothetical protein C4569_02755 [Candidatus Parcubacteria bacterium]
MKTKAGTKKIIVFFTVAIFLAVIAAGSAFAFGAAFEDKIYPNIYIGGIDLGGKDKKTAYLLLEEFKNSLDKNGLIFEAGKKQVIISPTVTSPVDPDLSYRILDVQIDENVKQAFLLGREGSWIGRQIEIANLLIFGKTLSLEYSLNRKEFLEILKGNFSDLETPARNAALIFENDGEISVARETSGKIFNYDESLQEMQGHLSQARNKKVFLTLKNDEPKVNANEALPLLGKVKEILATTTPVLYYDKQKWPLEKENFKTWLEFRKENEITVALNEEKTDEFLSDIAVKINRDPIDAKFKMEKGRVAEFQSNFDGQELNFNETYVRLNNYLSYLDNSLIELSVKVRPAAVSISDVNDLGIKELLGEGRSNFSGSPKNRRHNIAVGAKSLNGLLISPDEEFSLLKALGEIDAEHGYLPELVIKGNRTVPEFGGGLCQIGTTAFRVALNAGVPITRRQNHSYRVRYYEPPVGMDATIYNPSPDFRFKNDTGFYLLLTTEIKEDELIFRLYGTSDGRKVALSEPKIIKTIPALPTKYIETTDLAPGEKECSEHAIPGAETEFERLVTLADGTEKKEVWKSRYVPWGEICLVGVEKLSEPPPGPTSTDEILP